MATSMESPAGQAPAGGDMFTMLGPAFLANPYPIYAMLHAADPVTWFSGMFSIGGYIVTSHAICASVLRNKNFIKEGNKVTGVRTSRGTINTEKVGLCAAGHSSVLAEMAGFRAAGAGAAGGGTRCGLGGGGT